MKAKTRKNKLKYLYTHIINNIVILAVDYVQL